MNLEPLDQSLVGLVEVDDVDQYSNSNNSGNFSPLLSGNAEGFESAYEEPPE